MILTLEDFDLRRHRIVYGGPSIPADYFGKPEYHVAYDRKTKRFFVIKD